MKIVYRLFLCLIISAFLFGCSEKKSGIEGKLLDGRGQPLSGVTVIFKQVEASKGYEQFETKTLANGVFRIDGVMPGSEYIITPVSDNWKTKVTTKITALSEGQNMVLNTPIVVRFNALKDGTVVDTKTGLQWLIMAVTDINSSNVLSAVTKIKEGGFTDWRLPTKDELLQLQETQAGPVVQPETGLSQKTCCVWVAELNSENVEWKFYVDDGNDLWSSSKVPPDDRIVAVRNYIPAAQTPVAPGTPAAPAAQDTPAAPATKTPAASVTSAAPAAKTYSARTASPSANLAASKKTVMETPAPVMEKREIPAVAVAPAALPAAVVKSEDGVLRASRKACLANKGQPVKSSATSAPSVAAPLVAAPEVASSPVAASSVSASPAKQSPSAKVKTPAQKSRSIGNSVTIQFTMSKSNISPEELSKLKAFYAKIKGKNGRIVIEGNSDADGDAADNFRISGERALSVKSMLSKLDLNKSLNVKIAGLSDIKPIADSTTEEGRMLNRRADVTFFPESTETASLPTKQTPSAKSHAAEVPEVAAPTKQSPPERVTTPAIVKSEEGVLRASRKACIAKKAQSGK